MHTRIVFVCAFIGAWFVLSAITLVALLARGYGDTSVIVDGFLAESHGGGV